MAICNLSDLPTLLNPGECLLGLDPGSKIVGVAISDPGRKVASPLEGLPRGKVSTLAVRLAKIVQDRRIGGLVIGLPKALDGSEGPAAQSVRTLAVNLLRSGQEPLANLPVVFWDERFSTAAVQRFMLEDDMTRCRRAEKVDRAAAAYILQGALDALAHQKEGLL